MGQPPFGYMKDTDDPKRWVIDEEAAAVVRRIFSMTTDGFGTEQIAVALTKDYILSPLFYWRSKGINRAGKVPDREPHRWNSSSVIKILSLQEYCGDVINFKTYSKSYKNKKRIENDPDNWAIFKGVHDPIIEREVWEQVQSKRGKVRKRIQHDGEKSMFSGLLICADCGGNLNFHFNQKNHAIQYFNCANNNRSLKTCDKTHYVRVDFLEQVVLGEIRRLTQFASRYENDFVKAVVGHSQQAATERQKEKQQKVKTLQTREAELDNLFVRIYEDNASGKITDERFSKLSAKYETEQADISERLKELKYWIPSRALVTTKRMPDITAPIADCSPSMKLRSGWAICQNPKSSEEKIQANRKECFSSVSLQNKPRNTPSSIITLIRFPTIQKRSNQKPPCKLRFPPIA